MFVGVFCNARQRSAEAIAIAAVAAAAAAAAAAAPFQFGLCNNTLASLLSSLFSICHIRLGYSGFSICSGRARRVSLSVRYREPAD